MKNNSHNNQKKIAAINDISGFGRCSLTVQLPVISHMKVQCCPVITSVFSNHSGYDEYFFDDYTDRMQEYTKYWKKLGLEFEGIYTGFLGSVRQIDIVRQFISDFRTERTIVIVDPVMGDNGRAYSTYTDEMCTEMKRLVCMADIVTPNLTECCILAGEEYKESGFNQSRLLHMAQKISSYGPHKIVITGIPSGSYISNYVYEPDKGGAMIRSKVVDAVRCGTGDIFASIISADAVNGVELKTSVRKAASFIQKCIKRSVELNIPITDGVCFEEVIGSLK